MINLTIDNQRVAVPTGSTILEAARQLGLNIPTLCFLAGVKEDRPSCLACVVRVNGDARLVPSCSTRVTEGMVVASETDDVKAARQAALELLFSDHLGDCISVCQRACPAHLQIPATIRLVAAGKMDEAIALVKENIVFPGVLGRICRAPCEQGCRRRQYDGAVAIQLIEREVANLAGPRYVPAVAPSTGRSVAIVGAGATGLSAAFYLLRRGHQVAVLDAQPAPGGQLRGQVADEVLEADLETIRQVGLEFRGQARLGDNVTLEQLRREFDAVILAVGPMAATNHAALGVAATERMIRVSPANLATNVPGVFAGGTCIRSGWDPARSVGDGKALADSVDAFLGGRDYRLVIKEFTTTIPKLTAAEYQELAKGANAALTVRELVGAAETAAGRCCHCDCRAASDCRLRAFGEAYHVDPRAFGGEHRRAFAVIRQPGGVIFEPGKCISCGICVAIAAQAQAPLGLTFIGRGFDVQVAVPLDGTLSDGLQKVGAECVKHCPTGALALEADVPTARAARTA